MTFLMYSKIDLINNIIKLNVYFILFNKPVQMMMCFHKCHNSHK
jgi:hypothetical protein